MTSRRRRGPYIRGLSPAYTQILREKKAANRGQLHTIKFSDDVFRRWSALRSSMNMYTHSELAAKLIDKWEVTIPATKEKSVTEILPSTSEGTSTPIQTFFKEGKQGSKTESSCHVNFHAIHGLPLYMPFSMQYYSTTLNSSVQSKVYILVEQTDIPDFKVTPIRINVQGEMNEVMSDDLNQSYYQQLNLGRLFNWINISGIRNLKRENSASHYLNYDCVENNRNIGNHFGESNKRVDTNDPQSELADVSKRCDNFTVQTAGSSEEMCYTYSHSGLNQEIKIEEIPSDEVEKQPTVIDDTIEKHKVCNVSNMTGIINNVDKCGLVKSNDQLQKKRTSSQRPLSHIRLNESVSDGEEQQSGAFLKFDENSNPDSLPRSSRLRSKGYTIDYAKLNDFGSSFTDSNLYYSNDDIDDAIKYESSDIDDCDGIDHDNIIQSDEDDCDEMDHDNIIQSDEDDCDEMDQDDIVQSDEGDEELSEEVSGSMDIDDGIQSDVQDDNSLLDVEEDEENNIKRKVNRRVKTEQETDPDYIPYSVKKGKDDDDLEDSHESDSEVYNDSDDTDSCLDTPSQKKSSDEQEIHEKKVKISAEKKKKVQKLSKKPKRILVKLEEHTEKFFFENQVSVQMKDRGKSDSEKTIKVMVCSQCNRFRTKDKTEMERHLENHINGDLSCTKCDFIGVTSTEVSRHKSRVHRVNQGKHVCFMCKQRFGLFEQYKEHVSREHGLLPWICKTCSTIDNPVMFDDRDSYKKHAIENHKDKIHQCTSCGIFFLTIKEVKKHECEGKNNRKEMTTCDICGKVLSVRGILQHKRNVHFKIKMYPCKQCSYSATQSHSLKLHVQAKHEGVHSHKCDQCDFSCVRAFQLTSHKRTHSGHKPYKCDQCPYAAHWNVQLKTHRKLHGSPIGEECQICSIVVRKGATFKKHMKIEHGVEEM